MSVYPEGLEILELTFADTGQVFFLIVPVVFFFFFFYFTELLHSPKYQLDVVLLDWTALSQI